MSLFNSGRLESKLYRYSKVFCLREEQGGLPAENETLEFLFLEVNKMETLNRDGEPLLSGIMIC